MEIVIIAIIAIAAISYLGHLSDEGRNRSVLWHEMNGRYRVIYPDGKKSQRFTKAVAQDYRDIFGGTVVKAED